MNVLVANIGSTSFKFRVYAFEGVAGRELASGGVDRIGRGGGSVTCRVSEKRYSHPCDCADHAFAIRECLRHLMVRSVIAGPRDLDAVAFKAVMAGDCEPVAVVDERLLAAMEYYAPAAPAHNPAYVAAMRSFAEVLGPGTPLVAAFESGFHRTIPERRWHYAVPPEWEARFGIRRYGYHGASHRYVAERTAELMGGAERIISCHLGGSSSVCAIRAGQSVATSLGFSPQSGLPQGARVGEFDPFALAVVARETGQSLDKLLAELGSAGGLAALSGTGGDGRDIEAAAARGEKRAVLAMEAFATAVRDYIGAYLVELGGAGALVFTGGIGEHSALLRGMICRDLEFLGIALDPTRNAAADGECRIDAPESKTALWAMPTNEELIVARQAVELLSGRKA